MNAGLSFLDQLLDANAAGKLCVVAGSGVSADVGLPGWRDLMVCLAARSRRLFDRRPADWSRLAEELIPPEADLPSVYDALRDARTVTDLRDLLYEAPMVRERGSERWTDRPGFERSAPDALAKLLILVAERSRHRMFHCVTYNVDTLLEEAVAALGHEAEAFTPSGLRLVFSPPMRATPRFKRRLSTLHSPLRIRIAHPHGLLPRASKRRLTAERKAEFERDLIMGASDYDATTNSSFAPRSIWQLMAFSQLTCLFYGWSFNDYVVRRLLRIARAIAELEPRSRDPRHLALVKRRTLPAAPALATRMETRVARTLYDLGVSQLVTDTYHHQKAVLRTLAFFGERSRRPSSPTPARW